MQFLGWILLKTMFIDFQEFEKEWIRFYDNFVQKCRKFLMSYLLFDQLYLIPVDVIKICQLKMCMLLKNVRRFNADCKCIRNV